MQPQSQKPLPWYKVSITWLVFGIPLTAVLVGIVLLTLSVRHFDGLVVDDYYKRGLGINQLLQRQQVAASYGIRAELRLHPDNGTVDLLLRGNADFVPGDTVTVGLYHATRSNHDLVLTLHARSLQQFSGRLPALQPGNWNVVVESANWRLSETLAWPSDRRTLVLGIAE